MNDPLRHFNLYYLNKDFSRSIFQNLFSVPLDFTAESLCAERHCSVYKRPIVSAADIMIEQLIPAKGQPLSN
jgi:hypothetical protein